jgi:hypothetical protein
MDYLVVKASSDGELEVRVRAKIRDGWEPVGGASVACCPGAIAVLIQAMIRKPNDKAQILSK